MWEQKGAETSAKGWLGGFGLAEDGVWLARGLNAQIESRKAKLASRHGLAD